MLLHYYLLKLMRVVRKNTQIFWGEYGVISKGSQKANNNTCVSARHYSRRAYARTLLIKKTGLYGDILSGEFSL